jgi:hypothetical protein
MRGQDGRLAGWYFPRDHFETNISSFFELLPEEIPEVKYPQSYQATFGGTVGTVHMNGKEWCLSTSIMGAKPLKESRSAQLMLIGKRALIPPHKPNPAPPQRSAQQPILEILVQTTPPQQPTLGCPYRLPQFNSQR